MSKKSLIVFILTSMIIAIVITGMAMVLVQKNEEIDNYETEVNVLESKYTSLYYNYTLLQSENDEQEQTIQLLQENMTDLNNSIRLYQNGSRYEQHDPTFQEALQFMYNDETNENEYIEDEYMCLQFATETNNNAEAEGIRCYVVELSFQDSAHSIIGFDTLDRGMVYFEPQSDERVQNLEVGNDYWTDCIIPTPGYYYEEDLDDTIENIAEYW